MSGDQLAEWIGDRPGDWLDEALAAGVWKERRPTREVVLCDFDAVLNMYTGWKGADVDELPRPGVWGFLERLHRRFDIVIFTARSDTRPVLKWLIRYRLQDLVCMVTNVKYPAHVIVDDRCIQFDGDFAKAADAIENFRPYWVTPETPDEAFSYAVSPTTSAQYDALDAVKGRESITAEEFNREDRGEFVSDAEAAAMTRANARLFKEMGLVAGEEL